MSKLDVYDAKLLRLEPLIEPVGSGFSNLCFGDRQMLRGKCFHRVIERFEQVVDFIALQIERKGDVVTNHLEIGIVEQVDDVRLGAGEKVVDAYHLAAVGEQPVAQMGSEESRPPGNDYGFFQYRGSQTVR